MPQNRAKYCYLNNSRDWNLLWGFLLFGWVSLICFRRTLYCFHMPKVYISAQVVSLGSTPSLKIQFILSNHSMTVSKEKTHTRTRKKSACPHSISPQTFSSSLKQCKLQPITHKCTGYSEHQTHKYTKLLLKLHIALSTLKLVVIC